MMRYPWSRTEATLREMAKWSDDDVIELDFVNPETGADVLPTLGFTAMFLRPGARVEPPLRSASAAFHVVKGAGRSEVNGRDIAWSTKDVFSTPVFSHISHVAVEESFLIRIHDRPLQDRLGYYEERPR
jgi:gentisate 1,2-dioxygenase